MAMLQRMIRIVGSFALVLRFGTFRLLDFPFSKFEKCAMKSSLKEIIVNLKKNTITGIFIIDLAYY